MIERFTVTERGKRLLAKAQAGTALNYTKIEVGSGRAPEGQDPAGLTALLRPVKSIGISGVSMSKDRALVTAQFTNGGVAVAFAWNEVGLFAQDPSEGEILYARGEADEGKWVMIPAETEAAVSFTFSMQTVIGDAQDVTAVIDPSAVFLTQADLNKYVLNEGGDIAQTVVTFAEPASAAVADLTSGSATGTLMGRVKRLLASAFEQIGTKAASGHGHEQGDVKDLKTALDAKVPTSRTINEHALTGDLALTAGDVKAVPASDRGKANGVASLDAQTKVPAAQLPTIGVAGGGTGRTSVTEGSYLVGAATGAMAEKTPDEVRTHIGAAAKPVTKQYTLTVAGWAGDVAPYTQTIAIEGATATSVVFVEYAVPLSEEQRTACEDGEIEVSSKTDTTVTIMAKGTKPAVDVPIVAVILN